MQFPHCLEGCDNFLVGWGGSVFRFAILLHSRNVPLFILAHFLSCSFDNWIADQG